MTGRPACTGQTALMYSEDPTEKEGARTLCHRCPCSVRCLVSALSRHERHGIWGGFTEDEREGLIARLRARS